MPRPVDLAAEDLLVDAKWVVVKKWGKAGQHLVDQDAKGPPVNRFGVALQGWLLFAGCGCGCGWGNNIFFDKRAWIKIMSQSYRTRFRK